MLSIATGARRGELLALRWSDIDLDARQLTIVRSIDRTKDGNVRFADPKSAAGRRTIVLPAFAVQALVQHKAAQAAHRLRTKGYQNGDLVICYPDGTPANPDRVSMEFIRLVKRAGVTPISLHGMRHSFASLALKRGANMKTVQVMLGHANINITLGRYSHLVGGEQEEVAAGLDMMLQVSGL